MKRILAALLMTAGLVLAAPAPAHADFTSHTGPHNGSPGPNPLGTIAVNVWTTNLAGGSWRVDQAALACSLCNNVNNVIFKIVGSSGNVLYQTTITANGTPMQPGFAYNRYPGVTVGNGACWTFSASAGVMGGGSAQAIFEGWRVVSGGPASCHNDSVYNY